jgi:FkbM family methyltransferase
MTGAKDMEIYPRKQSLTARAAAWYLRDFPIARGRGLANRLLGKFLQVEVFDSIKLRLINPLEFHQKVLLFGEAVYEPLETNLFRNALKPGMVFFDVGANMGYYSLLASKRVAPNGSVHAFEPSPVQFNHLELNIGINRADNIVLNKCAVAESSGDRELFLSEGWNQGIHSLGKTSGQESSCRVPCVSIDDYIAGKGIESVDAIKVDVEGAELFVFKGAERVLGSSPPGLILFEACEEFAQSFGYSTCDVKQTVEQYGYALYRLEESSEPVRVSASSIERYANIVAIHSSAKGSFYKALESLYSPVNGKTAKSDE